MPFVQKPLSLRTFPIFLLVAIVGTCTSCKEHERLARQIADQESETNSIRTQIAQITDEINRKNREEESVRLDPLVHGGSGEFEASLKTLQSQVATLAARKKALSEEVDTIHKEFADFQSKK